MMRLTFLLSIIFVAMFCHPLSAHAKPKACSPQKAFTDRYLPDRIRQATCPCDASGKALPATKCQQKMIDEDRKAATELPGIWSSTQNEEKDENGKRYKIISMVWTFDKDSLHYDAFALYCKSDTDYITMSVDLDNDKRVTVPVSSDTLLFARGLPEESSLDSGYDLVVDFSRKEMKKFLSLEKPIVVHHPDKAYLINKNYEKTLKEFKRLCKI